jgi:hypothetical protein
MILAIILVINTARQVTHKTPNDQCKMVNEKWSMKNDENKIKLQESAG